MPQELLLLQRTLRRIRDAEVVPLEVDEEQALQKLVKPTELRTLDALHQLLNKALEELRLDWRLEVSFLSAVW